MGNKKYDVCAIGNALVDYEIEVQDAFFSENSVEKGFMTLVDEARQAELLGKVQSNVKNKQGGGSAANTIFALRELGGTGFYTCKVANDQDGHFFINDLVESEIGTNLNAENLVQGTTGKCLVMVSPDAERTMNTFLGITSDFSIKELDADAIKNSNYLFMEGFLVSSPTGLEAMLEAKKIAQQNGTKVALTFSDPSMVKYFKENMQQVVGEGVDLLFANTEEASLFTGKENFEEIQAELKQYAKEFVITKGENGSVVFDGNEFIEINPFAVKAVDTTGAGDVYAGGFLYGLTQNLSYEKAGMIASASSSEVVSKYGPRLTKAQAQSILEKVG